MKKRTIRKGTKAYWQEVATLFAKLGSFGFIYCYEHPEKKLAAVTPVSATLKKEEQLKRGLPEPAWHESPETEKSSCSESP